jgi:hypothetical protein
MTAIMITKPDPPALPDLVGRRAVAVMLGVKPKQARVLLERLGLPVIRAGQRAWFVRRDLLLQALGAAQ